MSAPEDERPENNHWITSLMITIVHPKEGASPIDVVNTTESLMSQVPSTWGVSEVVCTTSVGAYVGDAIDTPEEGA